MVGMIKLMVVCDLSNQKGSKQCVAIGNKRPIDSSKCDIDPPPPPKRGRKTKDVSDSHLCGSCSIWLLEVIWL